MSGRLIRAQNRLESSGSLLVGGATINKPSTTQAISAAGNSILANATMVVVDPNADYTMTSTPTIADGSPGQVLIVTASNSETNKVIVQDQDTLGSSNLQLEEHKTGWNRLDLW
jgi:ABC-type bacteriocin/lantibiotic exporter with double-glycine peptidase domain